MSYVSFAIAIDVSHTCHVIIAARVRTDVVYTRDWCVKKKRAILNASLSAPTLLQHIPKFSSKFSCRPKRRWKRRRLEHENVRETTFWNGGGWAIDTEGKEKLCESAQNQNGNDLFSNHCTATHVTEIHRIPVPGGNVRLCVCVGDKIINQLQRNDVVHLYRSTNHDTPTFLHSNDWHVFAGELDGKSLCRPFILVVLCHSDRGAVHTHINYISLASSRCIPYKMNGTINYTHHLD